MRAWRAYIEGTQRLLEALNHELQSQYELSLADYRILVLLSESPDRTIRMSDLADGVLSSRSRISRQIRRLEAEGIVTRSNCVDDRRGVQTTLTEKGLEKLIEAAPVHVATVRKHFIDLLSSNQAQVIAGVFETVDENLKSIELS
ncbi:MAG: MarR family winged helix-turn-helix transcriptional regulator [Mycobacteriaceae bacterium]